MDPKCGKMEDARGLKSPKNGSYQEHNCVKAHTLSTAGTDGVFQPYDSRANTPLQVPAESRTTKLISEC